jgi:formamidopyrimidine-DNA glycosylase
MPELPDVEGFRRVLAEHAVGGRVERVSVADTGALRGTTPRRLDRALRGHRFRDPCRHGKWLIAPTDGPTVLVHFGMTGSLLWCGIGQPRHPHDRVVFVVDGGELRYRDMRKLQGIRLARDTNAVERVLAELGPDAASVDWAEFDQMLSGRRRRVKAVLTDQTILAGLGNLLSDEILWRSRVHPGMPASQLTRAQRRRTYEEMRRVLRVCLRAGQVPARPRWLTGVRDRPGACCPRCGAPLRRDRLLGRTTVWCPQCQRRF